MIVLLEPHLRYMRAGGFSPCTIHDRKRLILAADRALPHGVDNPQPAELEEYLGRESWSQWTRYTYYTHFRGLYGWASSGHRPWLAWDPTEDLAKPQAPEDMPNPVTDQEVQYALERSDEKWRTIITLAAYAGLRVTDICRLNRDDVTQDTIRVSAGKGRKQAMLPTHPLIWQRIESYPSGLILGGAHLRASGRTDLPAAARRHFDSIDMPGVHMHRFRHWYATMLLRNGADIRNVQLLMRHSSLATTARYLLITDEQRRLAIRTLPVLGVNPQQEAA